MSPNLLLAAILALDAPAASRTDDGLRAECRSEAAKALGVEMALAVLDGTGDIMQSADSFTVRGNADLGDAGIKHFTCRFNADRAFSGVDITDAATLPAN